MVQTMDSKKLEKSLAEYGNIKTKKYSLTYFKKISCPR